MVSPFVWAPVASENLPPLFEILNTPLMFTVLGELHFKSNLLQLLVTFQKINLLQLQSSYYERKVFDEKER